MLRPKSLANVSRMLLTALGDGAIACSAVGLVVFVRTRFDLPLTRELLPPGKFPLDQTNLLAFALSLVAALALSGFYDFRVSPRHRPSLFVALPLQMALVAVVGTLLEISWPRTVFVAVPFIEAALLLPWRAFMSRLWKARLRRVILIGDSDELSGMLAQIPDWVALEGVVSTGGVVDHPRFLGMFGDDRVRRSIASAGEVIDLGGVDGDERRLALLEIRGPRGYFCAPTSSDALMTSAPFTSIGDHLLVQVSMPGAWGVGAAAKRAADLLLGLLLLLLSSPIFLLVAVAIAIDSRGPVVIRQKRSGRHGQTFGMWKFRTMRAGETGTARAVDGDVRVTRVGRWLRRYRLDELPQLLNVIGGSMSLVGPRPEIPELIEEIAANVPHFRLRLMMRPGIAGLAQTSAEYDQPPALKLVYDLQYLCRWSPALDGMILLRAVVTALSGRGV